jgi:glutaryl-CoA dehydrogenase
MDQQSAKTAGRERGGERVGLRLDVTSRESAAVLADGTEKFGRTDILTNTAGWDKVGPFVDGSEADWDRVIAINLYGVLNSSKAALPIMVGQGYGSVVNLGSDAGPVGSSGEAAYSAARGGVIALHFAATRIGAVSNPLIPMPRDREVGYLVGLNESEVRPPRRPRGSTSQARRKSLTRVTSAPKRAPLIRATEVDPRGTRVHHPTPGDDMTTTAAQPDSAPAAQAPRPISDRARDYLNLDSLFTAEEIALRDRVREFVQRRIVPNIAGWYEDAVFPREITTEMGDLGLLGMHLKGYGCAGRSAVEYGLAAMELEAGDSGLRTFVSVQGSLVMSAIYKHGSEEQKQQWLPGMAAGRLIGCFGLTEPTAGSDPGGMTTYARRDGSDWVLSGAKRWIGLASIADVAVIWAQTDDGIRGFVVPTTTPGFTAFTIEPKLSMRASVQCDIALDDVRLPADAVLPNVVGLKGPFACLNEARYGIIWGAMGAARDSYETALRYSLERLQFDQPLAAYQLTQRKLVDMVLEIQKGMLVALHTGRMKDAGTLSPQQISFGKLNNVREAIAICRESRTILGANGITLDYSPLRHANNLESVRTYEGTDEVHTLIMGQAITGLPAFR